MKNNLALTVSVFTISVSILVSILTTTLFILMFSSEFSKNGISGNSGNLNLSSPAQNTANITGYDWLQLNNQSDNKIHLLNGQVYITSPSLLWNGEVVATQDWVKEFCGQDK